MGTLSKRLAKLESQLQSLIERGSARATLGEAKDFQFSTKLLDAMHSSVHTDRGGNRIAADTYIVILNAETAQFMGEEKFIEETMIQMLVESCQDTGITLETTPRIKFSIDNSLEPGRLDIFSSFGLEKISETSTLIYDQDGGLKAPKDAFLILHGNEVIPLKGQVINLGRRSDNQIVIDDPQVSRLHAQIRILNNRYVIFDLDSTGGTFINKVRVEQAALFPGDVISLAGVDLVYGQDAGFFSADGGSYTQPMMPNANEEK
jgi:hypothetical protein